MPFFRDFVIFRGSDSGMNHPSVATDKKHIAKSKRVEKSKKDDDDDGPGPSAVLASILPFFGFGRGTSTLALA